MCIYIHIIYVYSHIVSRNTLFQSVYIIYIYIWGFIICILPLVSPFFPCQAPHESSIRDRTFEASSPKVFIAETTWQHGKIVEYLEKLEDYYMNMMYYILVGG